MAVRGEPVACARCGADFPYGLTACPECGEPVALLNETARRALPFALVGSILPPIGIYALVLGLRARREIRAHPAQWGIERAWAAIVLGTFSTMFLFASLWVITSSLRD